jgi:hypothetical protein
VERDLYEEGTGNSRRMLTSVDPRLRWLEEITSETLES